MTLGRQLLVVFVPGVLAALIALLIYGALTPPVPDGLQCRRRTGETRCEIVGSSALGLLGRRAVEAFPASEVKNAESFCPPARGRSSPGCWVVVNLADGSRHYVLSYQFGFQTDESAARINAFLRDTTDGVFEERESLAVIALWILGPIAALLAIVFSAVLIVRRRRNERQ